MSDDKKIPIIEMFGPTIQGEGALTGQVSYFIRTGGCPYRCSWCDSMHAVDPQLIKENAEYLTEKQILIRARAMMKDAPSDQWITLSGGDPLMWDLSMLVAGLYIDRVKIAVETQGSFAPGWLGYVDLITCSPKPPSSGMSNKVNLDILREYKQRTAPNMMYPAPVFTPHHWVPRVRFVLKVVIFDEEDLLWAEDIKNSFKDVPFYLSVGTPSADQAPDSHREFLSLEILERYRWLADKVLDRPQLWGSIIGPQMHTLLWGHQKGK